MSMFFEATMLICFGAAWPFSIWKSYRSGKNGGKSIWFLGIILGGYLAGITHKIMFDQDVVIALYVFNAAMVSLDIMLYLRNMRWAAR